MKHYFAVTIDSDEEWDDLKVGHLIEAGKKSSDALSVSQIEEKDVEGAHWPLYRSYSVGPIGKRK